MTRLRGQKHKTRVIFMMETARNYHHVMIQDFLEDSRDSSFRSTFSIPSFKILFSWYSTKKSFIHDVEWFHFNY